VAIGFQREFAAALDVPPDRVELDHVGLNHLTWERAAVVDGTDVLPSLIDTHGAQIAPHTGLPESVLHDFGAVPSSYIRYYWAHDAVLEEQRRSGRTRAEEVAEIELKLLAMYADPALDTKPDLLSRRGGAYYSEAAVALLASLVNDTGDRQVVNLRNAGTFDFLADDAVIEVPAVIGAHGAQPVELAPLPPVMRGLVADASAYEELALDAALRGGRDRVAAALLANPLVGQYELAGKLADRLIAENRQYLAWAGGSTPTPVVAGQPGG
jgi:6-phospho-beta-glucosidase